MDREERERERKGRGRRARGGIRGRRMEEMSEDWTRGSFNWTGSALMLMLGTLRTGRVGTGVRAE